VDGVHVFRTDHHHSGAGVVEDVGDLRTSQPVVDRHADEAHLP
jgi:hypothetical protein